MSVRFPYIAVICGEEHSILGWRGRKLITDKGSYVVGHIYGNWRIQDHRIFELVTIQSDGNGSWLLNGIPYSKIEKIPLGVRFSDIKTDENLRARKGSLCAVAWFDKSGKWDKVVEIVDEVLKFWKKASLPVLQDRLDRSLERPDYPLARLFLDCLGSVSEVLLEMEKFKKLLPAWSKPVWLSEFRLASQTITLTPAQKQLAEISCELQDKNAQLRQAQEAAGYNLQEALSKWFQFAPKGMSAERKARIESAVKMYMTDDDKRSLAKVAKEFGVSRKAVSEWFAIFTKETNFKVVKYVRHVSVKDHLQIQSESQGEE